MPKTPGRPRFQPTASQRRQVEQMAAAAMPHDLVAMALGIARGTLTRHFKDELKAGCARRRAEVVDLLFRAGRAGNVSALRRLEDLTRFALAQQEYGAQPASPQLGKKAQAEAEARSAGEGTDWGDDLTPPLAGKLH